MTARPKSCGTRHATLTPQLREATAVYCSMVACWWMDPIIRPDPEPTDAVQAIVDMLFADVPWPVFDDDAWWEGWATLYADAEALLRTGWTP